MTNFELWGPFTGDALHDLAPRRAYLKHRSNMKICFVILAVLVAIFCGLMGLSNLQVPQL